MKGSTPQLEWTKVNIAYPVNVDRADSERCDTKGLGKAEALLCHRIPSGWRFIGRFRTLDSQVTVRLVIQPFDLGMRKLRPNQVLQLTCHTSTKLPSQRRITESIPSLHHSITRPTIPKHLPKISRNGLGHLPCRKMPPPRSCSLSRHTGPSVPAHAPGTTVISRGKCITPSSTVGIQRRIISVLTLFSVSGSGGCVAS
jgi:hypothetical protein